MSIIYSFLSILQHLKTFIEIEVFKKRFLILSKIGKKVSIKASSEDKIILVIAHVVPDAHLKQAFKIERLTKCLDSFIKSLASFNYEIIILTKLGFSLHEELPQYLKNKIKIFNSLQEDPMFVEFDAFEIFKENINSFDHFIFTEDDILLTDSWFLEKIKKFNRISPFPSYVLLPHRFEYFNGVKYYMDHEAFLNNDSKIYNYSDILSVDLGDTKFCVYANPHAAFYCLNKAQMLIWVKSGYKWKNKSIAFGPLESAATFVLYENFKFLKPHPDNINYFEIQHFGNKYILQNKVVQE